MTTATEEKEVMAAEEAQPYAPALTPEYQIEGSIYTSSAAFDHAQRLGKMFASSNLVPESYRKNLADCIIAVQNANRLGVDPFMFMQNTYIIHGKPAFEAKFAIALMNSRGPYKYGVRFKYEGEENKDDRKCTAWGERKDTGEKDEATFSIAQAKAFGWWAKAGSMWPKMADQMLAYRAALALGRRHCPEVLLGMYTADEIVDVAEGKSTANEILRTS